MNSKETLSNKLMNAGIIFLFLLIQSGCKSMPTESLIAHKNVFENTQSENTLVEKELIIQTDAPPAPREFRAAWVATVSNIDWPSSPNLSTEQQKKEAITILDRAKEINLNAIILQVRPSADAIYPSQIEPWTEYLTGEQNRPPSPWYDPLQFWIEQAHLRGLELHAWFNPYRAKTAMSKIKLSDQHIANRYPDAVKKYGDLLWMDPSNPVAAQQTLDVITDVVRRYDVDGIHIDDYFYPYPLKSDNGQEQDFPDEQNWNAYLKSEGALSKSDWRRHQVNELVFKIYKTIHQEKSWVKFGISPFGIGKPKNLPAGISGFSQFDKLYADVELWLSNGWLDYLAPQLYWPINQAAQAFGILDQYWISQNKMGRHIWPGLYTSRIDNSEKSWLTDEVINQIEVTREMGNGGHIHFSMVALLQNRKDIASRLMKEKYLQPALVPETPWFSSNIICEPKLTITTNQNFLNVEFDDVSIRVIAIWKRYGDKWIFSINSKVDKTIYLGNSEELGVLNEVVITLVNRNGHESKSAIVKL